MFARSQSDLAFLLLPLPWASLLGPPALAAAHVCA